MSTISLSLAKEALEITHTAQDAFIQFLLDGVDDYIERFCGVALIQALHFEYLDGGGFYLWPTQRPVTSVDEVEDIYSNIIEPVDSYVLHNDTISRKDRGRWAKMIDGQWRVAYRGGLVPEGLSAVMLDLVCRAYWNRGDALVQQGGGASIQWAAFTDSGILARLREYVREPDIG